MKEVLLVDEAQVQTVCSNLLRRMVRTYFFYAKSVAEPGFGHSLYPYLYFYKIKNRLMSSIDILAIKTFLLMRNEPLPFLFESIAEIDHNKIETEDMDKYLKEKRIYFDYSLTLLFYLYVSESAEIYLSYEIDLDCGLYEPEMETLMMKILKEKEGKLSQEDFKTCKEAMMHPKTKFPAKWVKQHCNINKDKKII